MVEFATLAGARACGLESQAGSISVGKQADLILLDTNCVGMMPMNFPIGTVVESCGVSHVRDVMVAGRFVKRDGRLVGVDTRQLRARVEQARDALFERAGVPSDGSWLPRPYTGGTQASVLEH